MRRKICARTAAEVRERERVGERRERKERRENEVEMLKGKCVNSCLCRVLSEQRSLQRFSMSPA